MLCEVARVMQKYISNGISANSSLHLTLQF